MRNASARAFAVVLAGLSIGLAHCSSSSSAGSASAKFAPPIHHIPSAAACSTASPESADGGKCDDDAGASCVCTSDADCTAGSHGRCAYSGNAVGSICHYDACATASDCASGTTCACGDTTIAGNNVCVPFNCQVDSDCGSGGYCSQSLIGGTQRPGNCGLGGQYGGVYCHTANDDCFNDNDCVAGGAVNQSALCIFSVEAGKWTCAAPARCSG